MQMTDEEEQTYPTELVSIDFLTRRPFIGMDCFR